MLGNFCRIFTAWLLPLKWTYQICDNHIRTFPCFIVYCRYVFNEQFLQLGPAGLGLDYSCVLFILFSFLYFGSLHLFLAGFCAFLCVVFVPHYQCKWLCAKTHLQCDLSYFDWEKKNFPYSLKLTYSVMLLNKQCSRGFSDISAWAIEHTSVKG